MMKDGERTAISSRVAELDQVMPQYLGVSKAILDSVIFCHQDESLWPMSEPSALKKRFDEIFEAMKYTKAIENIKALRKKQNEELAKYKIMEQHSKEDKDKADRAEKRSIKLQEEIEALRQEAHKLSSEMRHAAELADKAWKESESYAHIIGALEGKRIEAKSVQASLDNLKRHLVEVNESDEWLQSTLEQFESRQLQYRQQEESQKERYMDIKDQIDKARHSLGLKQAECGKFENDKAQFERQVERREAMIREIARRNNVRGFEDTLDDMEINDFLHRLEKMLKDQQHALDRAKKEGQAELRETQDILNQMAQRKSALQETKNAAKRQITENDREAAAYQSRLNEIEVDEGTIALLMSKRQGVESHLLRLKETARTASWDEDIINANMELKDLDERSSKLNQELMEATKKAGELARLDHLRKELIDRERQLETMTGAHGDRIVRVIPNYTPDNLDHIYQGVREEKTNSLTVAERHRDGVGRDLELVELKLKNVRKELRSKQNELSECIKRIREATHDEPSEYPDLVKQRQAELDIAKRDADQFAGMGEYFSKCLDTARQQKVCRTCARGFKTETDFQSFLTKLEGVVKRATEGVEDETLRQLEETLENARAASTDYDTWIRLSQSDIPGLKSEEKQHESQRDALLVKIGEHDKIVDEKANQKRDIEALRRTVDSIVRLNSEMKSLQTQIQDELAKTQSSSSSRALEDIQGEITTIGENARSARNKLTKLTNEKDQSRADINMLELELRDVKSSLDNANHELDKKSGLIDRIEEYKRLNLKQRETIGQADQDIERLIPEIDKAQARHDDISRRVGEREEELQQAASRLSESLHQFKLANEEINSYRERGGPDQLDKSRNGLKEIEQEISSLEIEQSSITREINKLSAQLQDSENTKRQYSDNLMHRNARKTLNQVQAEIGELEAQNAEIDRSRFKEESERWTREHNALAAQQASKMGEMKSKDDQLMQLLADWNTDYKDAAIKYKEAHIKVETTKAAVDDLGRYGSALDKAIMKYHSLKMEEINRIIEELWQRTYRGTDVDTILIRSDNENAKGNRSYNYRVCMVKQGAEMDMRGRCSAGQKVLASIIIRLALAECFGVNCGLIALDEPTTNLDRDNIRSLAESLHDIINVRRQQANFQLIVITHDEEFLHHMQCGDFSDYYYRVSRNERQKSIIERQSIAEVCISLHSLHESMNNLLTLPQVL